MTRTLAPVLLALAACAPAAGAETVLRNLAYGADPSQRFDLTLPAGKIYPTVIFFHGGSLVGGDKADEDYRNVCAPFPAAGVACANVNYRLGPANAWPAQAQDTASAVASVRKTIAGKGGDPQKLFLFGHSSGALLVALIGTDERYLARVGLKLKDVSGVIPMGSIMWDDELTRALDKYDRAKVEQAYARDPENKMYGSMDAYLDHWPIGHVRAGQPPFLFLIAEGEQERPPVLRTNVKFIEAARKLGNSADYKVLVGHTHYTPIHKLNAPGDSTFVLIRDFVRGH